MWNAISFVLRNAFVNALQPSIDHTITLGDVEAVEPEKKTFLQKIFGKDDKENEKKSDKNADKKESDSKENKSSKEEKAGSSW